MINLLFIPRLTQRYFVWRGRPVSNDVIKEKYKVSQVLYVDEIKDFIVSLKGMIDTIHVQLGEGQTLKYIVENIENVTIVNDLEIMMNNVRSIKSEKEIELISRICAISSEGHNLIMKKSQPGLREYQFESLFQYHCSWKGCRQMAYPSIVGSGPNSAILHYVENNRLVQEKEFVLVDAGAEFLGYSSDITRTFPSDGKFTDEQKLIYHAVLNVQKTLITMIKPGLLWKDFTQQSSNLLLDELLKAGMVKGTVEELYTNQIQRVFMPHGLGHHIGLDVHDTTIYPDGPLVPGMIVTVEPGLYFNPVLIDECLANEEKKKKILE